MQTSKFECVIAGWIFSSRQGRTAPSKKELVTIERGDINQRVPFFMPLSLEWGHFLLLSYLQFQLNTISFTAVILLQTTWALCRLLHCHGFWSKLIIGNEKTKETLFYSSSSVRRTFHNHQSVNCKRAGGNNSRLFIIMMTSKKLLCYSDFISAFILS